MLWDCTGGRYDEGVLICPSTPGRTATAWLLQNFFSVLLASFAVPSVFVLAINIKKDRVLAPQQAGFPEDHKVWMQNGNGNGRGTMYRAGRGSELQTSLYIEAESVASNWLNGPANRLRSRDN